MATRCPICMSSPVRPFPALLNYRGITKTLRSPIRKIRLMPDSCITLIINLLEDETRLYDPDESKK
jgi:hypothetical protein